jgi:hypothetical protein
MSDKSRSIDLGGIAIAGRDYHPCNPVDLGFVFI